MRKKGRNVGIVVRSKTSDLQEQLECRRRLVDDKGSWMKARGKQEGGRRQAGVVAYLSAVAWVAWRAAQMEPLKVDSTATASADKARAKQRGGGLGMVGTAQSGYPAAYCTVRHYAQCHKHHNASVLT